MLSRGQLMVEASTGRKFKHLNKNSNVTEPKNKIKKKRHGEKKSVNTFPFDHKLALGPLADKEMSSIKNKVKLNLEEKERFNAFNFELQSAFGSVAVKELSSLKRNFKEPADELFTLSSELSEMNPLSVNNETFGTGRHLNTNSEVKEPERKKIKFGLEKKKSFNERPSEIKSAFRSVAISESSSSRSSFMKKDVKEQAAEFHRFPEIDCPELLDQLSFDGRTFDILENVSPSNYNINYDNNCEDAVDVEFYESNYSIILTEMEDCQQTSENDLDKIDDGELLSENNKFDVGCDLNQNLEFLQSNDNREDAENVEFNESNYILTEMEDCQQTSENDLDKIDDAEQLLSENNTFDVGYDLNQNLECLQSKEILQTNEESMPQNSDNDDFDIYVNRGSRKKKVNSKSWKKVERKFNRNNGLPYLTNSGKTMKARKTPKILTKCCTLQCYSKFTNDDLENVNKNYWSMGDYGRQRDYIKYNVRSTDCSRVKKGRTVNRQVTNKYFLDEKLVCKLMFISTLNIGPKVIQVVKQKENLQLDVGQDRRGGDTNSISTDDKELVRKHIKSFPLVESHYCRQSTKRLYFHQGLNQIKLYELYKEMMTENYPSKVPVKESFYKKIFCTEFNISFHSPKKDACKYCEENKNGMGDQMEFEEHMQRKKLARLEKKEDKEKAMNDSSFRAFTFDLEAVLYSPCSSVSSMYYTRKFSTYNFTIYEQALKEGYCFLWNETNGMRGSDEIGTILFMFLRSLSPQTRHVSFFSDSCGGQNRNRFIATLLKMAVAVLPLVCIDLKFLEVGHTDMEVDCMHSVIERHKKNINVFSPLEWTNIVLTAKRKDPYIVNNVFFENIYDLKILKKEFIKGNMSKNINKESVNWMQIKWIRVLKSKPDTILYKTSFADQNFQEMNIGNKMKKIVKDDGTIFKQKYKELLGVTVEKRDDLLKLCRDGVIPKEYHGFYENLTIRKNSKKSKIPDDSSEED